MRYLIFLIFLTSSLVASDQQLGLGPVSATTSVFPGGLPSANQIVYSNGTGLVGDPGFTYGGAQGEWGLSTGTITSSTPSLSIAQTWNNSAVSFTGIKESITSTAALAGSSYFDVAVGGSTMFRMANAYSASNTMPHLIVSTGGFNIESGSTAPLYLNADFNQNVILGTGVTSLTATTDATAPGTAGLKMTCGIGTTKNVISAEGIHGGVTITATAAGTTTLTSASTAVQVFTGSTTQTIQLPAAALFGAGVSVHYTGINRSTGSVSWQRAGSDDINGATSNVAITTLTAQEIWSDGVSNWYTK